MNPEYKEMLKNYRIEFIIAAAATILVTHIADLFFRSSLKDFLLGPFYDVIVVFIAVFIFVIAWISYPKIFKFKILLTAAALIAFFINFMLITNKIHLDFSVMNFKPMFYEKAWVAADKFSLKFLLTILNINLFIIIMAESSINYDTGKHLSWVSFGVNILFYLLIIYTVSGAYRGNNEALFATKFVKNFNNYFMPLNLLIFTLTAVFSFYSIEAEHNYGSIVVAISLMVFYCSLVVESVYPVRLILPGMGIIIIVGIFQHWVSCLHHKAHYDPLLKIYNRQYLNGIMSGIADVKLKKDMSIMMCDIDHFKKVNDTYGHAAGDAVLYKTAQTIRDVALKDNAVVCRYGGEEIVIILPDKTGEEAKFAGEKIRKAVKKNSVKYKSRNIKVTLSIGVASTHQGLKDIKKVIKKADDNVYKAKKSGRDKVVI